MASLAQSNTGAVRAPQRDAGTAACSRGVTVCAGFAATGAAFGNVFVGRLAADGTRG